MTTRVHLIRHGVTESNRQRRYMGRSDEGLSSEGRRQVRQLALRGATLDIEAVYSSPLRRARDTAEIVGQPYHLRPELAADFTELDLSRWEGLTANQIEARDGEAWQTWCADPARLQLPGIEPFTVLQQRVRRGIEGLLRQHAGGTIAVVTHDGIVRMAVLECLGISLSLYRAMPIDNTGLTTLDFAPERTYLRRLNDIGHLREHTHLAAAGPADR